ncbi:hypothetical protein Pcinc_000440 [Petrolisthes cinctipes]|uniref:Uncharacterized protein n=1 Tax=Petrolisthes cinctipes TaxID=88211 RepID=A0AAE1L6H0_PETCI|nr:hypothetical protein Pcinc_000440 [Petrolisthes cinctipes]
MRPFQLEVPTAYSSTAAKVSCTDVLIVDGGMETRDTAFRLRYPRTQKLRDLINHLMQDDGGEPCAGTREDTATPCMMPSTLWNFVYGEKGCILRAWICVYLVSSLVNPALPVLSCAKIF